MIPVYLVTKTDYRIRRVMAVAVTHNHVVVPIPGLGHNRHEKKETRYHEYFDTFQKARDWVLDSLIFRLKALTKQRDELEEQVYRTGELKETDIKDYAR